LEFLPDFVAFKPLPATPLKDIFIAASDDLLDLIQRMLMLDPLRRVTATDVSSTNNNHNKYYLYFPKVIVQYFKLKLNLLRQSANHCH